MNHRFLIDFCVFYSLFFRGPCVDYREILSVTRAHGVTLNKRFLLLLLLLLSLLLLLLLPL